MSMSMSRNENDLPIAAGTMPAEISTGIRLTHPRNVDISTPMIPSDFSEDLSRRERQVVEIIIRLGRATARDIEREIPDPPTYSAVRSILRILVEKNLIVKKTAGGKAWYAPSVSAAKARTGALRSLVNRFFANSTCEAACALLGDKNVKLSKEDADKLMKLIEEARSK